MRNGTLLEKEVYNTISKLIENGSTPFQSKQCKVYSHKKYYSQERQDYIETDVSVEVFIGDANEPCLIWIWECKNYSNGIPVDDLEEFHSKLEQIGADNTKGTIITSDGYFQKSSISYARAKKIGLARLLPNKQVEYIMYLITSDTMDKLTSNNNSLEALTVGSYRAKMQDTFILDNGRNFSSLEKYILKVINTL